jgi:hypothetical protein
LDKFVTTKQGTLRFHHDENYGYFVDDKAVVHAVWISDARYKRPHEGLVAELQMYLEHGKSRGDCDFSVETFAVLGKAGEWNALAFIPQDPTIGGYVVTFKDKFVTTEQGTLRFHRSENYGYLVDDKAMVHAVWISDARYKRPHEGLVLDLQMYIAHGKSRGDCDFSVETFAVLGKAGEWNALEFIPQDPTIGGYVVSINMQKFREHLGEQHNDSSQTP